jgi:hypothetical protein
LVETLDGMMNEETITGNERLSIFYTVQSIRYGDAISSVASSNSKSFSTDSMLTRKS